MPTIATRLSRNGERLIACLDVLRANETAVDAAFEAFFPDLVESAGRMQGGGESDPHPHDEERKAGVTGRAAWGGRDPADGPSSTQRQRKIVAEVEA